MTVHQMLQDMAKYSLLSTEDCFTLQTKAFYQSNENPWSDDSRCITVLTVRTTV